MKIGILVLFVNSFGKKGLYNSQEIGIAKELHRRGHNVVIYKCVGSDNSYSEETIKEYIKYVLIPVKTIGNNAVSNFDFLDQELDALLCFSDIQLYTKKVYKWAKRNDVVFIPYVGITHSTSPSFVKRTLINFAANTAINVYKKSGVFVKTNAVKNELLSRGVTNIVVAPVGLDFDLLNSDYDNYNGNLFDELNLLSKKKYILMVGRIANDRNPLDVVSVFKVLHKNDPDYRLIIIGKGPMKEELKKELTQCDLMENVIWIEQVQNSEMWKYYRVSNALVSFSRTEIFGMSILEAMYYELPVYVIRAPGPNDIIVDNESGFLFSTPEDMAISILNNSKDGIGVKEHQRVVSEFSWVKLVNQIELFVNSQ